MNLVKSQGGKYQLWFNNCISDNDIRNCNKVLYGIKMITRKLRRFGIIGRSVEFRMMGKIVTCWEN